MKMTVCKHCKNDFSPVRSGHFYCSDTCRKLAHKAKKLLQNRRKKTRRIAEKLSCLASSNFGRYLVYEVRRAGTVQVLHGHTHSTLQQLADLRAQCKKYSGYEDGKPLSFYELSHIWPVSHPEYLGLLNSKNLVIATKSFNRRHATKFPTSAAGMYFLRDQLENKWAVNPKETPLQVLKRVRRYIGIEFDIWLKKYTITYSQRHLLVRKLTFMGYQPLTLAQLSFEDLKKLCDDEEIRYFSMTEEPKPVEFVLMKELERCGYSTFLCKPLEYVYEARWTLSRGEMAFNGQQSMLGAYADLLCEQAQLLLHGQAHLNSWENLQFIEWWTEKPKSSCSVKSLFCEMDDDVPF
jgi:hypothetical protein